MWSIIIHFCIKHTYIPGVIYVIAVGHHSQQVVLQQPVDGGLHGGGVRHDGGVGDHGDAGDVLTNFLMNSYQGLFHNQLDGWLRACTEDCGIRRWSCWEGRGQVGPRVPPRAVWQTGPEAGRIGIATCPPKFPSLWRADQHSDKISGDYCDYALCHHCLFHHHHGNLKTICNKKGYNFKILKTICSKRRI